MVTTVPSGEGWHPDPEQVHQYRYFDGTAWTDHVASDGAVSQSPRRSNPQAAGIEGRDPGQEATADPELASAAPHARAYSAACVNVIRATDDVLVTANRAVGARRMAEQRPQHEISIRNFLSMASKEDEEFVPKYKEFAAACAAARQAAERFRAASTSVDPELMLITALDDEAYGKAGVATHILRAELGPTPSRFVEGLESANAAIQADIFSYGESGFLGHVYSPPATAIPDERTCPWCAETIKVAAIICRFCGRDVAPSSHPTSADP